MASYECPRVKPHVSLTTKGTALWTAVQNSSLRYDLTRTRPQNMSEPQVNTQSTPIQAPIYNYLEPPSLVSKFSGWSKEPESATAAWVEGRGVFPGSWRRSGLLHLLRWWWGKNTKRLQMTGDHDSASGVVWMDREGDAFDGTHAVTQPQLRQHLATGFRIARRKQVLAQVLELQMWWMGGGFCRQMVRDVGYTSMICRRKIRCDSEQLRQQPRRHKCARVQRWIQCGK